MTAVQRQIRKEAAALLSRLDRLNKDIPELELKLLKAKGEHVKIIFQLCDCNRRYHDRQVLDLR